MNSEEILRYHSEGLAFVMPTLLTVSLTVARTALVVETLGVGNQERLRWTKNGRLGQSGSVTIRRAHTVAIQAYDPDRLAEISSEDVRRWRESDDVGRRQKVMAKTHKDIFICLLTWRDDLAF